LILVSWMTWRNLATLSFIVARHTAFAFSMDELFLCISTQSPFMTCDWHKSCALLSSRSQEHKSLLKAAATQAGRQRSMQSDCSFSGMHSPIPKVIRACQNLSIGLDLDHKPLGLRNLHLSKIHNPEVKIFIEAPKCCMILRIHG
jgi:hypothetical protein